MQTILMFGGDTEAPRGGAQDLMGVLPFLAEDTLFGAMLEHIRQNFEGKEGIYWMDILVMREGSPLETRRWKLFYGNRVCREHEGPYARRTEEGAPVPALLVRETDEYFAGMSVA